MYNICISLYKQSIHTYIYIYIHINIYIYIYMCICIYVYIYIYICIGAGVEVPAATPAGPAAREEPHAASASPTLGPPSAGELADDAALSTSETSAGPHSRRAPLLGGRHPLAGLHEVAYIYIYIYVYVCVHIYIYIYIHISSESV